MSSERKEPTVSSVLHSKEDLSDRRPAASTQRVTSKQAQPSPSKRPAPAPAQSSSGFVWFTFLMTLIAVSGAGYALWQLHHAQAVMDEQRLRIVKLERKLTASDDTATQTLASVGAKVRELDKKSTTMTSEIDKLWAARNVNRKAIADSGKKVEGLQKEIKKLPAKVSNVEKKVASVDKKVAGVSRSVETLKPLKETLDTTNQNIAEQELLVQSLRERVANQNEIIKQLSSEAKKGAAAAKQVKSIDTRLKNTEEAMTSIEAFRRTVNRDLLQLKQGGPKKP